MKRIFFTILIFLFASISDAQLTWKDLAEKPYDKRIKEVTVWRIEPHDTKPEEPLKQKPDTVAIEYDSSGNAVSYTVSMGPRRSSSYHDYPDTLRYSKKTYNERGLLINNEGYRMGIDQPHYSYSEYAYDDKGRIISRLEYDEDHVEIASLITSYDDKNLVKTIDFDIYNQVPQYSKTYFDKLKRIQRVEDFYSDGTFNTRIEYSFPEKRYRVVASFKNDDSIPEYISHIKYDKKGQMIEKTLVWYDGSIRQRNYFEYDKKGRMTIDKWVDSFSDDVNVLTEYEYDPDGKGYSIYKTDENRIKVLSEKFYFRKEGWIEKTETFDEEGKVVLTFKYEYILWEK